MPIRVLVVDSDPIVRASCRRVLEERGFRVVAAASVEAGVEEAVSQRFGLLIVDMVTSEGEGLQLVHKVRGWGRPVPAIVMSAYPTSEAMRSGLESGALVFLPKPFTPEELLAALQVAVSAEPEAG